MKMLWCMLISLPLSSLWAQVVPPTVSRFPSLSVRAGSRGMGMGDQGIAIAGGTESLLYNPAMSAFTPYQHQIGFSYMPWMTAISNAMRMMRVGYVYSVAENGSMGVNLGYLDLGQIDLRDDNGATLASYRVKDYHLDLSYAQKFAEQHCVSVSLKFLGQNQFAGSPSGRYGFCGDLSYYGFIKMGSVNQKISFGAVLSNLGPKSNLPSGIGIGIGYSTISASGDIVSIGVDANRLLGDEWKAIRLNAGAEYGFAESVFIRGGLSLENQQSGGRTFFSLGAGYQGYVSDQRWDIDLHYVLPFGQGDGVAAFQNNYGITLSIHIGNFQ